MAININNLGNNQTQVNKKTELQNQQRQQAVDSDNSAETAKKAQQDSVSLTPQAKQLTNIEKQAKDTGSIDQQRVERLKRAIASGEYKIDPEKLARNIINFELQLP